MTEYRISKSDPLDLPALEPGDVVRLERGGVWSGGLTISDSGEDGNPITFTAYGEGERPVIEYPTDSHYRRAVVVEADYVIIEKLLVRNAHLAGVYVADDRSHNVVRDMEITDTGSGIKFDGSNNLALGNHIHDLNIIKNTPGGDDDYGATAICLFGPDNEAAYNRIERCSAPSYDYGTDGGGFEFLSNSDGSFVHHNWVEDSAGFLEVGMGTARNVIVTYNVSVNNGRFSWLHLIGDFVGEIENFRVEHNTIIEPGDNPHWVIFGFGGMPYADTFILRNNIIWVNDRKVISNDENFTHDYNLYYLQGGTALGFDLGTGEQIADPLFVDFDGRDFYLMPGSPAIWAGVDLGYEVDIDGVSVHSPPSLGAYEFIESGGSLMSVISDLETIEVELRQKAAEIATLADSVAIAIQDLRAFDDQADALADMIEED